MTRGRFVPAVRTQRWGRIAVTGVPGSGRVPAALHIATALASPVAVVDTQRGATTAYALDPDTGDGLPFDVVCLSSCSPDALTLALATAATEQYPVVVVSSLSHCWSGRGGVRAQAEAAAEERGGDIQAGWRTTRAMEQRMLDALLNYPGHVVAVMRSRVEWITEDIDSGRRGVRRVGTRIDQREGIDDEFDFVVEADAGDLLVVKSRAAELAGRVASAPGVTLGQELRSWLGQGAPAVDAHALIARATDPNLTREQVIDLIAEIRRGRLLHTPMLHPLADDATTLLRYVQERHHELASAQPRGPQAGGET